MNLRLLVSSLLVLAACPGPAPTEDAGLPVEADAGRAELDAGPRDEDAGTTVADAGLSTPDAGPCSAVPVTPVCTAGGWCWKNPLPLATQLNDVWANGCSAWAAGLGGMLLERTTQGWVPRSSGTTETLNGFASFAPDDAWLVGENGTVLHFDGTAWSVARSNTTSASYRAAYAPARGLVFIAASDGIHRYQAGVLTTIHAPARTSFSGISGRSVGLLRAVGEEYVPNVARNPVSWSFDGATWTQNAGSTWLVRWNRVADDGVDFYAAGKMNAHGPDWGFVGKLPWQFPLATTQRSSEFLDLAARGPRDLLAVGRSGEIMTGCSASTGRSTRRWPALREPASRRLTAPAATSSSSAISSAGSATARGSPRARGFATPSLTCSRCRTATCGSQVACVHDREDPSSRQVFRQCHRD